MHGRLDHCEVMLGFGAPRLMLCLRFSQPGAVHGCDGVDSPRFNRIPPLILIARAFHKWRWIFSGTARMRLVLSANPPSTQTVPKALVASPEDRGLASDVGEGVCGCVGSGAF
jgi:hypothetical protein